MFLNQQELIELTSRRHSSAQARVLRFMGIEHKIRPDGSVAVLAEHVKTVMGMTQSSLKTKNEWTPKWSRHA